MQTSTTQVVDSIEQYDNVVSWINDTLIFSDDTDDLDTANLIKLDQQITQLLTTLDIASEDSSSQLEHIIDDVSRGIPRLAYDLHFMKDGALTLQSNLADVLRKARGTVPSTTDAVLKQLHDLDLIKNRMESAREVLREAESWSTLELEVTSLIAEKSYAKAAERLSEANKSMVVFQNTPEYDPRRNLMVNLQNQLEASLSSALVSAINAQDVANCKEYFAIFSVIQRESEFRNYYYAARRSSVISLWSSARLIDCDESPSEQDVLQETRQPFTDFLSKFYNTFTSVLNVERTPICSIFPDPHTTLSSFIASTISSLQPTYPQRLSTLSSKKNDTVLTDLTSALRLTEEFAVSVDQVMEKVKFATSGPMPRRSSNAEKPSHVRRRSSRMSISWRPGQSRSGQSSGTIQQALSQSAEVMEWEQELFQPFLDFQIDYGSLEKRFLEHSLAEITVNDSRGRVEEVDRPRLLRERAVDIFGLAEGSMGRCNGFTHGYGAVGLVWALDNFFKSFMELWTAELQTMVSQNSASVKTPVGDEDLAGMDYSGHDWTNIQLCLHLLSSARTVSERLSGFEMKLRTYLSQVATQFSMARDDPINFRIGPARGENQLLEQSTLNSAELRTLLETVGGDQAYSRPGQSHQMPEPLLVNARRSLSLFAQTCQATLQRTILSPLRQHLSSYASLPLWSVTGDPKSKSSTNENDLKVPTFSLPPSETMQKVAEGLLNLPRLFEVYADDDALSFSLGTLPHLDYEILKGFTEQTIPDTPAVSSGGHMRRASVSFTPKPAVVDPEAISSAWLLSLGHTFLEYVVQDVLSKIPSLSASGAAQLASDLEYLTNIVRALNVEHEALEQWRLYSDMEEEDMRARLKTLGITLSKLSHNPPSWPQPVSAGKLSREEFRRQKDLDAARKAGTAPAALDEEGKPINPHIPQYISQAPWYLDTGAPSLSHQRRPEQEKSKLDTWYDRGVKAGPAAKKYRKGACENCGSMSHSKKDCLERPRKKGAKFTNKDIQADDVVQDIAVGYDAKRDRYNGYDPAEHSRVYEQYAAMEAARQKLREEEIDKQTTTDLAAVRKVAKAGKAEGKSGDPDFGSSDEEDADEDKYADAADAVGQKLDTKTRITVRNLRIREDTAKYLLNLDPESAYYDPKTRSMRDAPLKNVAPEDAKFAGENFFRYSGEVDEVQNLQLFAWNAAARGNDVHLNANPTAGELLHKEFKEKKAELKDTTKVSILAKYGGEQYLQAAPRELRQGQTEDYVEYSRTGQVVKGRERAKNRSKYPEDVFINNHTTVWGSWYDPSSGTWGYACCHSTVHISYCAGKAGIEAAQASSAQSLLTVSASSAPPDEAESNANANEYKKVEQNYSKKRVGEGDVQLDKDRLVQALSEEKKRKGRVEDDDRLGKRRKGVIETGTHEVTEEQLEAYRMTRRMAEDPMANYVDEEL
ncbi:hypothetical protein NP233_g5432 [Leucocoprinus birnbaumii]|uniref:Pre-mRNA-splicing factor SLU7 n=1 Tax=Leucocoprinus birnbaumii TaxID=56174 RepID=A0AAD5YWR6_9AGAR|nr:hypothetical protein NP233_g5432 [Leucocoprinus birnbaumii]